MTERGIIFSGQMVKAILDGTKTQTRRILRQQPYDDGGIWRWKHGRHNVAVPGPNALDLEEWAIWKECPYQIGQTLWVRETWAAVHGDVEDFHGSVDIPLGSGDGYWKVAYRADDTWETDRADRGFDWRPSMFMPRWASRITLTITDVRVQRIQEISEDDAKAEGALRPLEWVTTDGSIFSDIATGTYRKGFAWLWGSINAKRGYGWDTNPWVWAISFRREP